MAADLVDGGDVAGFGSEFKRMCSIEELKTLNGLVSRLIGTVALDMASTESVWELVRIKKALYQAAFNKEFIERDAIYDGTRSLPTTRFAVGSSVRSFLLSPFPPLESVPNFSHRSY
ncbi:MAG: hypothetical protein EOP06_23045, partial [Proteobacteria bacterium]